jgi:putative phosphoserine phosphatase/1-acylglycerol-3-phosphate O-acyltransferase
MATYKELMQRVEAFPNGPKTAAIFDFDGTIIAGFSAVALIKEQLRRGDITTREFIEMTSAMLNFGMGTLGFSGMMAINAQFMRGINEQTYIDVGEQLFVDQIAKLIYPESRSLIEAHLAKGHTVAIISSATPYQLDPAARELGIEHVLCTHLEIEDGKFTGGVVRPTCAGPGKVLAAEQLAVKTGANLDNSIFYSDSDDDIELMERIGYPQPLNPNKKLASIAAERNWSSAAFGSRGRPSFTEYVRSVAATGSLVSSFAAGLPIWALTGSRRKAINFSFNLFADTASALIGLDLKIKNEHFLWKHRPAVFIFNHQSKADVIIIAKLLRQDIAGVGKQEIRKMPFIGKVMELGGVVFIDRQNSASAIEAMAPLVEAIKEDGKSVALAPEGTRTISAKLAPFKKGAFHLAMDAGVPIVPIVIRNAGDVAPKGDFVFRSATVNVEVLPPVDTSAWTSKTIEKHVKEVRDQFVKTLGQDGAKTMAKKPVKNKPAKKSPAKKSPVNKKLAANAKSIAKTESVVKKVAAKVKKKTAPKAKAKPIAKVSKVKK